MANFKTVQILSMFPDSPQFSQVLPFGGRKWTLWFTWRPRLQSWFCDIYDDALAAVVEGRRVVVGSNLTYGVLDFPGGLIVFGKGDTDRYLLGKRVQVVYMELEDDG